MKSKILDMANDLLTTLCNIKVEGVGIKSLSISSNEYRVEITVSSNITISEYIGRIADFKDKLPDYWRIEYQCGGDANCDIPASIVLTTDIGPVRKSLIEEDYTNATKPQIKEASMPAPEPEHPAPANSETDNQQEV